MVDVHWYYPAYIGGGPAPGKPESVGGIVAKLGGVQAAVRGKAHEIADRAQADLDRKPKLRTYKSQVTVTRGNLDYYVNLDEGSEGKGGSWGIEKRFGILGGAIG